MLLTDYFRSKRDATWDIALSCGVTHGVIRLPEDEDFDPASLSHWETVHKGFTDFGITPLLVEPMPNALHDHIKAGDEKRDECIEKVIAMFPIMKKMGLTGICFNWMAHVGWFRTTSEFPERGGAKVTAFNLADYTPGEQAITAEALWDNYKYFIKAALPEAEKNGIHLLLHPDDPPLAKIGKVERIMVSRKNIRKALYEIQESPCLGLTMCQANFHTMGENVEECIEEFAEKIGFVHFRNVKGKATNFHETFHDNGELDMAALMDVYYQNKVDCPIRIDHVPTMAWEESQHAGYDAIGRLFAIGYMKGLIEATERRFS